MANGNGKRQMWQCSIWASFDVETSYGGLKVSEIYQDYDYGIKKSSKTMPRV